MNRSPNMICGDLSFYIILQSLSFNTGLPFDMKYAHLEKNYPTARVQ